MNKVKTMILLMMAAFLMAACSASFENEQKETEKAVMKAFQEQSKKINKENRDIQYYLPFGFEIEEETPNNILLKNGSKSYILFYNQKEDAKSKVVYNATIQQKEYDIKETFRHDQKFGFLLIQRQNDDLNELTVGVGGVKVTSMVKTSSLKNEAAIMMSIANSVRRT